MQEGTSTFEFGESSCLSTKTINPPRAAVTVSIAVDLLAKTECAVVGQDSSRSQWLREVVARELGEGCDPGTRDRNEQEELLTHGRRTPVIQQREHSTRRAL